MLVDAVDGESVEHVERPHPFRVTLGQIVVDGDHVHTVAGQGVEEHGQGGHEGLTFTRCHLGNLTLMQGDTAEELHVVVHHFPFQVVSTSCPVVVVDGLVAVDGDEVFLGVGSQLAVEVGGCDDGLFVLGKAASCLLHNAEGNGHHLVERLLVDFECLLVEFVNLVEDGLTLIERCLFNRGL